MKQAFPDIVANVALRERMRNEILGDKISHAYILEGAKGSGKHSIALQLAAALSCEKKNDGVAPLPCGVCPSCRKILGGYSTDVIYKNRGEKATLGVEVIRDLKQDVYIPPNDTAAKIYIIEDAHLMTTQAQNAFLLTLEEPPSYVLFLLLCESTAPLLETVRSRAPTLRTESVPSELIDSHICRVSTDAANLKRNDPSEFSEILAAADGSIGLALALLDPKKRKSIVTRRQTAREFVRLCTAQKSGTVTLRFLNSLPQKRDELSEQLEIILYCLRDLLLCKQAENAPLCFFAEREEACALAYDFTTPELLTLCECTAEAIDRLRINANVRLTLTALATSTGLL